MKLLKTILVASTLSATLFSISAFTKLTPVASGNAHVTGGGTAVELGKKSTFSFNAINQNGSVSGHINYNVRADVYDLTIKVDVDCMTMHPDGKTATISGIVRSVTGPGAAAQSSWIYPGQKAAITVQDNGNGKGADLVSDMELDPTASCTVLYPPYIKLDGNVDVKQ